MNLYIKMLVFLLIFGLAGCGKKVWPEPDASMEKFSISIVGYQLHDNCLEIQAEISGNIRNLAGITLELEASREFCPACPFLVSDTIYYEPGAPGLKRAQNMLIIEHCGLDPDMYYRARLRAGNVHSIIREETTRVVIFSGQQTD